MVCFRVLIAALTFEVRSAKRGEFVSAVTHLLQAIRWSAGCRDCRLLRDCENRNMYLLVSEWEEVVSLQGFLGSPEFDVLEGTGFLLQNGPRLTIDQVVDWIRPSGQPAPSA